MANKKIKKQTSPEMVSWSQALKNYCYGYVDFSGTATRAEYWWVALTVLLGMVGFGLLWGISLFVSAGLGFVVTALFLLVSLGLFLPSIALAVRRIHDAGMSAWVYFGPYLGLLVIRAGNSIFATMFGDVFVTQLFAGLEILADTALIVWGLVLMLLPSKLVDNKYRKQ